MADLKQLIGMQLQLIRKSRGLTQDQVADLMTALVLENSEKDVSYNKSRISRIEGGSDNITLDTLEKIMKALQVSPYELFDFIRYQNPADIQDKREMIELHKYTLLERPIEEVQYVVRTASDFLKTMDTKAPKRNNDK